MVSTSPFAARVIYTQQSENARFSEINTRTLLEGGRCDQLLFVRKSLVISRLLECMDDASGQVDHDLARDTHL